MRIFLTGATGFIGTALIPELLTAGHTVLGLTRSQSGADTLTAAGVTPLMGSLEDLESLKSGAAQADAVIHLGFDHDFSNFIANCQKDEAAILAMGSVLVGSAKPILITSGTAFGSKGPGQPATEDYFDLNFPHPRRSEHAGAALSAQGVNVSIVRLPQVHDTVKQGIISYLIPVARQQGRVAYLGEGQNPWSAAHVSDVAHLYRLVLERAQPGSRYNAVAEPAISARTIAEAIARGLNLPAVSIPAEEAPAYFGWLAGFAGMDMSASNTITRQTLNWNPTGPDLLTDLHNMDYTNL